MGSCVSSPKCSTPNSAIKRSQNDMLVVTESSFGDPASTFKSHAIKEETFFDSQPWLESDCEDDFLSVKDDFTPTCGNTPVHSSMGTPSRRKTTIPSMPEPFPKSTRLSQLFQDSRAEQQYVDELSTSTNQCAHHVKGEPREMAIDLPESNQTSPYASGAASFCSSGREANEDIVTERGKSVTYRHHHCLPSLISCSSSRERKKTTPVVAVYGRA